MITVAIQLISRPEMSFVEMVVTICRGFPGAEVDAGADDDRSGVVRVTLDQNALTAAQRDWLHLSPFASRYIDSYKVQSAADALQQHKDSEAAFLCVLLNAYAATVEIDDNDEVVALAFERVKELGWVLIVDENDTFTLARQAAS